MEFGLSMALKVVAVLPEAAIDSIFSLSTMLIALCFLVGVYGASILWFGIAPCVEKKPRRELLCLYPRRHIGAPFVVTMILFLQS
jgi:hypothetical protein